MSVPGTIVTDGLIANSYTELDLTFLDVENKHSTGRTELAAELLDDTGLIMIKATVTIWLESWRDASDTKEIECDFRLAGKTYSFSGTFSLVSVSWQLDGPAQVKYVLENPEIIK